MDRRRWFAIALPAVASGGLISSQWARAQAAQTSQPGAKPVVKQFIKENHYEQRDMRWDRTEITLVAKTADSADIAVGYRGLMKPQVVFSGKEQLTVHLMAGNIEAGKAVICAVPHGKNNFDVRQISHADSMFPFDSIDDVYIWVEG